jgi:hypothetical protein
MAENNIVWEKQVGNLLLRKIKGADFKVSITKEGETEDKGNVTMHYIILSNVDHSFEITWREDTLVFQLLEECVKQNTKETEVIIDVIVYTSFMAASSADVCHTFRKKNGEQIVDGLRLSVQSAISEYLKRTEDYLPLEEEEPEDKIIDDMRAYADAQKAFDDMQSE